MTKHKHLKLLLLAAALLGSLPSVHAAVVTNWAAFNDHVPGPLPSPGVNNNWGTAPNANRYNMRGIAGTPPEPTAGVLKDYATGLDTPAYFIATATGSPDFFGSIQYPGGGTPGSNLFNGIVDLGNNNSAIGVRFNSAGYTAVTLTFSNLNPALRYKFRGTSVRGNNNTRRWTLASLQGVDSFTNAHTAGVFTSANFPTGTMTNGQAAYNSGENRADGALVGWDDIAPGTDGLFSIKCEQYVDNPLPNGLTPDLTVYGYAFSGIYLAEVGEPVPVTITVQPPAAVTVEQNRTLALSAVAVGAPAPDYQWYKDDVAIAGATSRDYVKPLAQPADSGNYYVIASNVLNTATSIVSVVTVYADTNGPALLSVKTDETFQRVTLTWNETISEGPAIEISNYYMLDALDNEVLINTVQWLGSSVVLNVPTLQAGATYRVEADFQQDIVGNLTDAQGIMINPIGDPDHFVTSPFQTFVISPGFTRFQAYLNLPAGQTIGQFVAMPIYPNGHTFTLNTNVLYWPQTLPGNGLEQYAMRFSGLFVAPETGLYKFGPDHDDDVRLRISDSQLPSGTITEVSAACCTGLLDGPTLDVSLTAGQRYYYELIVREFGGGDHAGISVVLPSGPTNSPISQEYLALAFDPANTVNAGISQQPQTTTVLDNHAAAFSVTVTNALNGVAYQWQLDSGGGFNNIAGAVGSSHTTGLRTLANEGNQYRVIVYTPGLILTSAVAILHVNVDGVPPEVLSVRGTRSLSTIRVTFNEAMSSGSATEVSNYTLTLTNGTPVGLGTLTLSADLTTVTITTDPQTPGAYYNLLVENVTDLAGNAVGTTNIVFQSWVLSRGFALFEAYDTGGGNDVVMLTSHPSYPNNPRDTAFIPTFDSRNAYPNDSHEAYGARISALFTANATTNFVFYFSADDASEFWMSTDSNPANRALLRSAVTCCTANSVNPVTNALVAGQTYYMDLLYKEGTGGDYGRVVVKHIGDPTNPDILTPIGGGQFLSTLADPVGAIVAITQQPTNQTRLPGQTASFSVQATGMIATGVAPLGYQWQKFVGGIFVDIAGANNASYTTPILIVADTGAQYRALVFIPGNSAISATATVTVIPPPPTLHSSFSGGILSFSWDAPARLQCTFSLTPPVVWLDVTGAGVTNFTVDPANEFNAMIDAAQEANPVGARTGTGMATVTLSNNVLKVNGNYAGMSTNRNNIHFHAPAIRSPAATAGVAYNLASITTGTTSGTILGDVTMANGAYLGKTVAAQIQDLRNGLWYFNIHSTAFPGGEIRGQVEVGPRFYRLINP